MSAADVCVVNLASYKTWSFCQTGQQALSCAPKVNPQWRVWRICSSSLSAPAEILLFSLAQQPLNPALHCHDARSDVASGLSVRIGRKAKSQLQSDVPISTEIQKNQGKRFGLILRKSLNNGNLWRLPCYWIVKLQIFLHGALSSGKRTTTSQ